MVLAERKDLDVLHNDELIMVLVEDGAVDNVKQVLLVSLCEEQHSLRVALWGLEKALTVGVLAQAFENGPNSARQLCKAVLLLLIGSLFALARSQACVVRQLLEKRSCGWYPYWASSGRQSRWWGAG